MTRCTSSWNILWKYSRKQTNSFNTERNVHINFGLWLHSSFLLFKHSRFSIIMSSGVYREDTFSISTISLRLKQLIWVTYYSEKTGPSFMIMLCDLRAHTIFSWKRAFFKTTCSHPNFKFVNVNSMKDFLSNIVYFLIVS